jgi:hypothetical protein
LHAVDGRGTDSKVRIANQRARKARVNRSDSSMQRRNRTPAKCGFKDSRVRFPGTDGRPVGHIIRCHMQTGLTGCECKTIAGMKFAYS